MTTCRYCQRRIVLLDGSWIDPEATGDDSIWRETCDEHDTFAAEHEAGERTLELNPLAANVSGVLTTWDDARDEMEYDATYDTEGW